MKIVIQKVKDAHVVVAAKTIGSIGAGFVLLVGIETGDTEADLRKAADKIAAIRLFSDAEDKLNLSIRDVGGCILSISQFTLLADCRKGNRPSFIKAMPHEEANHLFNHFNQLLQAHGITVVHGAFRQHMNVFISNDGPVTVVLNIKDGKVL